MDQWLLDHLIRAGHLTETGLGRRLQPRTCTVCKQPILAGLDDDTCATEARIDPQPLNPYGEAMAHIEGRRTHSVHHHGGRYVIDWRDADHIADHPAGTRTREDIHRQHICWTPPPTPGTTAPTTFAALTPASHRPTEPDF